MSQIDNTIEKALARRAKYGGPSYHVHVRRVVNFVIKELDLELNYTMRRKLVQKIIDTLESMGAKLWGIGFRNCKRKGKQYNDHISRIYAVSG